MTSPNFRSGYIALIGRPNAGKSTLLNKVLGEKVSITSHKPQTTRNRVVGIYNGEVSGAGVQAILVDTPGHYEAQSELNRRMVRAAEGALAEVDAVALLIDLVPAVRQVQAGRDVLSRGERALLDLVKSAGHPCVLGLNKIDVVSRALALPVIEAWRTLHDFAAVVPFSALTGLGVDGLMGELVSRLPVHPPFFPTDQLMDGSERFVVSEIIREKLFHLLNQELPYSTAVVIEAFEEEDRGDGRAFVRVGAKILVERSSQKGIVIGKGGQMLRRVGTLARKDIQKLLGCGVHLDLFVSIDKDWTRSARALRRLGYD